MKILCSSLLIAALVLLSPSTSAQRSAAYGGISATYARGGGYVSSRIWVPGHYENVSRRVFVPGGFRQEWVEAVYEWRVDFCGMHYVCVREGYWRTFQLPGHWETRCERVYRSGSWVARASR